MDRLIDCLSVEKSHSGHKYLARRLREAVEKKKQHPDSEWLCAGLIANCYACYGCLMCIDLVAAVNGVLCLLAFI